jgi:hypothetical protein
VYEGLTEKLTVKLIKTRFSVAYEKYLSGYGIYRGMTNYGKPIFVTPGTRTSVNTNNFYTRLFSGILDSWSNYPKRERSIICTSSPYTACGFGTSVCVVLPENKSLIGICPTDDIWQSFSDIHQLTYLNDVMLDLFDWAFGWKLSHNIIDLFNKADDATIIQYLNDLDVELENLDFEEFAEDHDYSAIEMDIMQLIENRNCPLIEFFNDLLDPDNNRFMLKSIEAYRLNSETEDREVWTEAQCLLIPILMMPDINEILNTK